MSKKDGWREFKGAWLSQYRLVETVWRIAILAIGIGLGVRLGIR